MADLILCASERVCEMRECVWVRGSWPTYLRITNLLMPDSQALYTHISAHMILHPFKIIILRLKIL